MNGYEGPAKSGTLKTTTFTPADYNAWLSNKERGNSALRIKAIDDEVKTPANGFDNKQIAAIWKKISGKDIS
jgi:hypothetical protein